MPDRERTPLDRKPEEIIEAFDRERAEARELNRRHAETVRNAREADRQVFLERRRRPR